MDSQLKELAENKEKIAALRQLADELRLQKLRDAKPPLTLDQYGELLGFGAAIEDFILAIERFEISDSA